MRMSFTNKGIALFVALALLFLLSATVITVLLTAYNHTNATENLSRRMRAVMLAESGLNYARWQLRNDSSYSGDVFSAGSGVLSDLPAGSGWNMTITVDDYPASGGKRIRSKVDYPKAAVIP